MDAVFVCDVGALVEPDVAAVDALARLQLAARRSGCRITLQGVAPEMGDLLELMGLTEILPCDGRSGPAVERVSVRGGAATRTGGTAAPCRGRS